MSTQNIPQMSLLVFPRPTKHPSQSHRNLRPTGPKHPSLLGKLTSEPSSPHPPFRYKLPQGGTSQLSVIRLLGEERALLFTESTTDSRFFISRSTFVRWFCLTQNSTIILLMDPQTSWSLGEPMCFVGGRVKPTPNSSFFRVTWVRWEPSPK